MENVEIEINLSDAPTLPQLAFIQTSESGEGLRIIQRTSAKCKSLGTLLLDDKDGAITDSLVANHPNNTEEATRAIFQRWLTSGGREPLTWSTVITVLKQVGLTQLAQDIEKLAGKVEVPPSTPPPSSDITDEQCDRQIQTHSTDSVIGSILSLSSIDEVRAGIRELKKKFSYLKEKIRHCIEEHRILVAKVADVLTQLSPDEDEYHRVFVRNIASNFSRAENHSELFLTMNSHWNYLDPGLLNHLVDELELDSVKPETESYKADLKHFRKTTPLNLFLQTQKRKRRRIPSEFTSIVATFNWPSIVMLENVEEFRQEYASHYSLHECAMMLIQVRSGSFVVVWLVPVAIVEKLRHNVPTEVLTKHRVQKLTVDGNCVYSDPSNKDEPVDENRSSPVASESYYIDESSEEETASNQDSLTLPEATPRTLSMERDTHMESDTPLAISVSSHSDNHTPVPESQDFAFKAITNVPSLGGETPSLPSAEDDSPVTNSETILQLDNEAETMPADEKNQTATDKIPQPIKSTHEDTPKTISSSIPTISVTDTDAEDVESNPSCQISSEFVQARVRQLKKRFKDLKKLTQEGLVRKNIAVERLADHLKSLTVVDVDGHKLLTENYMEVIDQAINHSEIIGNLGFNMNYLSYQLLESIATNFNLKDVTEQIQTYKKDLAEFRLKTPVTLFSQRSNISLDYKEVVVEFVRPYNDKEKLTLDTFHQFQEKYAGHYQLSDCAMIFGGIRLGSSVVTTTWFVPTSITKILRHNIPNTLLNQCRICMLKIAGFCVYQSKLKKHNRGIAESRTFVKIPPSAKTHSWQRNKYSDNLLSPLPLLHYGRKYHSLGLYTKLISEEPTSHPAEQTQCHDKKRAPFEIIRGSATTDGQIAYFTSFGSSSLYQYHYATEEWEELPECQYRSSGVAIINGELTTIGGDGSKKLMTLRQGKWVEDYPPMLTGRSSSAVVTTSDDNYLFVIGGRAGGSATVELLQLKTRKWYIATNLPEPLYVPSATVCGNQLNVIGWDNGFSCTLKDLLSSDQPITSPITLSWTSLPPLPVQGSTAASLCGQLILVGGTQELSTVDSIHQLEQGQWMKIGSMTSQRWMCSVVSLSPDKILIVGGFEAKDEVEK